MLIKAIVAAIGTVSTVSTINVTKNVNLVAAAINSATRAFGTAGAIIPMANTCSFSISKVLHHLQ